VTRRCLEKDPRVRFQSATDLSYALDLVSDTGIKALPPQRARWPYAYVGIALLALAGLASTTFWAAHRPAPSQYFTQLTFRPGAIGQARFVPGTDGIVYAARWNPNQWTLYEARADGTDVRPIVASANWLLAVSSRGEAAVRLNGSGRLARVPLSGGAPHELMDYVSAADWSPDGRDLAVAFRALGRGRIQFPIGKTIYESDSWIRELRVSHSGERIAFLECPFEGDDQGALVVIDSDGAQRVSTNRWIGIGGLAWSADDKEIWFTATNTTDSERAIYAWTNEGTERLVLRAPGPLFINDISQDGRVLLNRVDREYEVVSRTDGGETRKLGWAQIMIAKALSANGEFAVIDDWSSREYRTYLAPIDGGLPMLLGPGTAADISPDGRWVAAISSDDHNITLLPTGVGQSRTITTSDFHHEDARWTADGKALIVKGYRDSASTRFWLEDIGTARLHALTPEGLDGTIVRIEGKDYVVIHAQNGAPLLYPVQGQPVLAKGLQDSDTVIGGSAREPAVYVLAHLGGSDRSIEKLNIANGQRQQFVQLSALGENASITSPRWVQISGDGEVIVYTQQRQEDALFIAKGLK
jgi:hypothetical protein